jgi:hypothetical protein
VDVRTEEIDNLLVSRCVCSRQCLDEFMKTTGTQPGPPKQLKEYKETPKVNDIELTLAKLKSVWLKSPGLRLGQLIINAVSASLGGAGAADVFMRENEDLRNDLEAYTTQFGGAEAPKA